MSADELGERLQAVQRQIAAAAVRAGRAPTAVQLLAVSKTHPPAAVRAAYALGQRNFGENRVQELVGKAAQLGDLLDLRWHMIGSLQTNKVAELLGVPGLALLHSLDRVRLADELQRELARRGGSLDVLLQVHATGEPSKHGCPPAQVGELLAHVRSRCPRLRVQGLMAMGPLAAAPEPVFAAVATLLAELRAHSGQPLPILSLGMSGDLDAAIAAGSTLVRLGTAVFGTRS
jgi:pyridoxal phosphate enzyme (YggS family)